MVTNDTNNTPTVTISFANDPNILVTMMNANTETLASDVNTAPDVTAATPTDSPRQSASRGVRRSGPYGIGAKSPPAYSDRSGMNVTSAPSHAEMGDVMVLTRRLGLGAGLTALALAGTIAVPRAVSATSVPYVHVKCSANAADVVENDTPTITCVVTTNSSSALLNEIYPANGNAAQTATAFCTVDHGKSQGLDGYFCEPPGPRPGAPVYYYVTVRVPTANLTSPKQLATKICADGYTVGTTAFNVCRTVTITQVPG